MARQHAIKLASTEVFENWRSKSFAQIRFIEGAGVGLVELILTVCTLAQPASCEERRLSLVDEGSLMQCLTQAPPVIAEWSGSHPGRQVVKWRCSYPGSEDTSL